jgi:hypothetical protein
VVHTKSVTVDSETYEVTQFGASKGMKMLTRLTKILGEPMGMLFAEDNAEVDKALPLALKALSDRLDEEMVLDTVKQLLTGIRNHDGEIQFETHFAGRLGHMFKLLSKVLEVQFGDFLGVLGVKGSGIPKVGAARKTL